MLGFSAHQKISAVMRVIAYGIPADYADEYLRIGEETKVEIHFAKVQEAARKDIERAFGVL